MDIMPSKLPRCIHLVGFAYCVLVSPLNNCILPIKCTFPCWHKILAHTPVCMLMCIFIMPKKVMVKVILMAVFYGTYNVLLYIFWCSRYYNLWVMWNGMLKRSNPSTTVTLICCCRWNCNYCMYVYIYIMAGTFSGVLMFTILWQSRKLEPTKLMPLHGTYKK